MTGPSYPGDHPLVARGGQSIVDHVIEEHGGFWMCTECFVGSPADEWEQEGDGWTCPDCKRNIADPTSQEGGVDVTSHAEFMGARKHGEALSGEAGV